jgi:peptidoglycan/LPS O-acetylase OafA/YrhL
MTIERKNSVREFAIARAARLMPTFVAALLIASVILMFSPMPPLVTPTLPQFVANLTMAPSLFDHAPVDLPYWSLTYELLFYVAIAAAMRLGLLRWIEWLGLAALAVSCVLPATVDFALHRRTSIMLMVHYSNFFLIGICLFRIHAGKARPVTYLALACAIAITARGGGEQAFYAPGRLYLPLTAAVAALVWLATSRYGKWLAWRPLLFLGRISYPLYLVHVVLGFTIIRFGVDRGWSTTTGVIVAGTSAVALAVVLHYLVEVPGGQWSRASLQKLKPERVRRKFGPVKETQPSD